MSLTAETVAEVCGRIERGQADFAADPANVAALHEAFGLLQWLRGQYHDNRAVLDGCVGRLRELREKLLAIVRQSQQALTAEYIKAGQAARAWQDRQTACRDLLAEVATLDGSQKFDSPEGQVDVTQTRTLTLPPNGSAERTQLLALLDESGRWSEVAAVNPLRLARAMDTGRFAPDQVDRLTKLCPVRAACRLAVHRLRA
jgi:hypothetical protein